MPISSKTTIALNNGTFTKKYLPPGTQSCSAILNLHAPPGFDLNGVIAAGRAGGANPFANLCAVGHNGTFDLQRSSSGGNTTFYWVLLRRLKTAATTIMTCTIGTTLPAT